MIVSVNIGRLLEVPYAMGQLINNLDNLDVPMLAEFIMLNCVDPHTTSLVTFGIRPSWSSCRASELRVRGVGAAVVGRQSHNVDVKLEENFSLTRRKARPISGPSFVRDFISGSSRGVETAEPLSGSW